VTGLSAIDDQYSTHTYLTCLLDSDDLCDSCREYTQEGAVPHILAAITQFNSQSITARRDTMEKQWTFERENLIDALQQANYGI
jgi:hypothetical protein